MRTGSLIALVGMTALGLSGCASIEKVSTAAGVSTSTGAGDAATSGVDTDSATGSDTGTSTGQSNTSGNTSFVFNDGAFNIDGTSKTDVTVANAGGGINVETATVAVNTGLSGMTWADNIEMALFRNSVSTLVTDGLSRSQDYYNTLGNNPNFTGYKEYRKITSTTDAELQVWSYNHSSVAQYTVYNDPSASNNNNVAVFFDGNATPTSGLPAATVTYLGKFGGTTVASNFIPATRTVADPFVATASTNNVGHEYDPNGTWRVIGDTTVVANFGTGTVTGQITNTTYHKHTGTEVITILPSETNKPFHNYTLTGTITDNTFSGGVSGPAGVVVTGNNGLTGGFFGPNAEEIAGVVSAETTSASPSDGITLIEANRRGFITMRGVIQGTR